jgi:HrpA-like RNA helicase
LPNISSDYVTSGVLLKILGEDPTLSRYTHIFLDEVHEREAQGDILFMLMRNLLQTHRPDLKVVLMSATADTSLFQDYFSTVPSLIENKRKRELLKANEDSAIIPLEITSPSTPPIVLVKGKCYPVQEKYLDDILPQMESRSSKIYSKMLKDIDVRNHIQAEKVGYDSMLPLRLLEGIIAHKCLHTTSGSILVFLPGLHDIADLEEMLLADKFGVGFRDSKRFRFYKLHSSLEPNELNRVFEKSDPSVRKIILATNIAETSITVYIYGFYV